MNGHTLESETVDNDVSEMCSTLPQKAHEHLVVACAVKTWLICDDLVSLIVVSVLIIAA